MSGIDNTSPHVYFENSALEILNSNFSKSSNYSQNISPNLVIPETKTSLFSKKLKSKRKNPEKSSKRQPFSVISKTTQNLKISKSVLHTRCL